VSELLYKEEVFQLVGLCMEIHRELGKGHDEIISKDALVIELSRAGIPFSHEKNYEITYKGGVLPHYYYADFVVWDRILFEAKAVELSGCLDTSRRFTSQFRRRCVGMETAHFIDTNYTNVHEWDPMASQF
jgi:GxxExxY protein